MISTGVGLLLLSLVSGDALVICGGNLAHIDTETGTVTQSVGTLHTYPNDVVIQGDYVFVVNSGVDAGTLQRFELNTWDLTELGIGTGWNCWASLPLQNGKLAVSAALNNSITMVDPEVMAVTSTVNGVGPTPEWMAEKNGILFTACGGWGTGNSIVAVNTSTGAVTDTLAAGTNCQSLAVSDGGLLFVTCSGTYGNNEGKVVVIDPASGSILAELPVGGFPSVSTAANGVFYTSDPWNGGVFSVNMATMELEHDSSNPLCAGGDGLTADDQGNLWVTDSAAGEVRVYDAGENLVQTYSLTSPGPIAVSGSYNGIQNGEPPFENLVSISPNPAMNSIRVTGLQADSPLEVFDITGRKVAEGQGTDGTAVIQTEHLAPGLYCAVCGEGSARFAVVAR